MNEEIKPEVEYQIAFDSAIKQIHESSSNFHLVISPESKAEDVAESLRQKKISGLLKFKGPRPLEKIVGKTPETTGTPVMMVNSRESASQALALTLIEKLIDSGDSLGNNRPSLDKKTMQLYEGLLHENPPRAYECNLLLKVILKTKCFEGLTVVVDTTVMDRANDMARGTDSETTHTEMHQKDRAKIGENLKTFRAATGAQIVIISQKDTSFASESGNNGMELGHDIFKINLLEE